MNELQLLPNPTNVPEAVFTGYQRQNTNLFCLQTGLDTTEPNDNDDGTITILEGGIVEVNGSLFKLPSEIEITKPDQNTAYWLAVFDNGDGTANITTVTRPGKWNPAKQGCYYSLDDVRSARTLNWVSLGVPDNLDEDTVFEKNTKGTENFTLQQKVWYYADLQSGLGAGNGADGNENIGGAGGVAATYKSIQKIFFNKEQKNITIKVGGNGWNGGNGGAGTPYSYGGGGGGGSGGGEATCIPELNLDTGEVRQGNGGNGSGGRYGEFGGGGGAGFIGGNGGTVQGGKGGNNNKADNDGGDGTNTGGGGGASLFGKGGYGGYYGTDTKKGGAGGVSRVSAGGGGGGGSYNDSSYGSDGGDGGLKSNGSIGKSDGLTGGGGGAGSHGSFRNDDDIAAGYCNIYELRDIEI